MHRKLISGLLVLTLVFTSVPVDVMASGTFENNKNEQLISNSLFGDLFGNLFGSNDDKSKETDSSSSQSGLFGSNTSSNTTSGDVNNNTSNNQGGLFGGSTSSDTSSNTSSNVTGNQGGLFGGSTNSNNSTNTNSGNTSSSQDDSLSTLEEPISDILVTGRVTVGSPAVGVASATVLIGGVEYITDEEGNFSFNRDSSSSASIKVEISAVGYADATYYYRKKDTGNDWSWSAGSSAGHGYIASLILTKEIIQTEISGAIVDSDDSSTFVEGAKVVIGNLGEVTAVDGTFKKDFDISLADSPMKVTIEADGYESGTFYLKHDGTDWIFTETEAGTTALTELPLVKINSFTVTFKDGSVEKYTLEIDYESKIDENDIKVSQQGYTTVWYKDSSLNNKWNFDTDVVTEETTLYVDWIANVIDVVIDYDGSSDNSGQINSSGLTTGKVRVGEQFTLKAGTKSGYSFDTWSWTADYANLDSLSNSTSNSMSIVIPALDEGDKIYINANWKALSATINVENIIEPETDGDSCYVSIYNSEHGEVEGVYNSTGSYSGFERYDFDLAELGEGMYSVHISTTSGQEMVDVLYVSEGDTNTKTIQMLALDKVVSVTNYATNVPNATSDNLSEMFTSSELTNSNYISMELVIDNVTSDNVYARIINESVNPNQQVGMFLDVTLTKYDNGTKYSVHEMPNGKSVNVIIQLPDSFKDQKGYFVSTVHDNMYSTISSANVKYDKATNSIAFSTKKLSVFGIGFIGSSSGTGTGGSTTGTNSYIPTAEGYNVPKFQNVQLGQWIIGLGEIQLVHPEPTKWKFAGWYFASTEQPLTAKELEAFEVTTDILTYGIYPRFVQVDADGNIVTTPVPQTGRELLTKLF